MPLKAKDTLNALLKKGFVEAQNKSNDHKWVEFWHNGKLTRVKTKFSHNGQEINDFLISQMSKQTYLTKPEFIKFASCEISQEGYEAILKTKGFI